jgi:membrane protein involved in colicin uptake
MSISAEQLLEAAKLLGALDGDEKKSDDAEAKKAEAEAEAKAKADAEAEKAKAEAEAKAKAEAEKKAEEDEGSEEPDILQELRDKVASERLERTKSQISSAFVGRGFAEDEAKSVLGFLDYGKLMSNEGDVDEDKVAALVDSISSLSLRKPPRGEKQDFSSSAGGIGKYLTMK